MDLPIPKASRVLSRDDDPFECLPDHILHHILSKLPRGKDAARTTLVSRSWQRAWSSYPLSDFDIVDFLPAGWKYTDDDIFYGGPLDSLRKACERFLGFTDRSMSRLREQGISLPRLRIWACLVETDRSPSLFDKWIGMALDDGAQELDLKVYIDNRDWSYWVPARVFSSDFIKALALHGERLIAPLDSVSTVNLNSLQTLKLIRTPFNDQMLHKLLRGCPLLENLVIHDYYGILRQVTISGLSKLRMIDIVGGFDQLEIDVPSLEKFSVCVDDRDLGRLIEVGEAAIIGLDGCQKLKELSLSGIAMSQEELQQLLYKFPLLEGLVFERGEIKKIRILHPLITNVKVSDCDNLLDIEIDAPRLSCFVYDSYSWVLPIIRMMNPSSLSKCEANIDIEDVDDADFFINLGEFLNSSCGFRSLNLHLEFWVHLQLRDNTSLPCGIDKLYLHVYAADPKMHAPILDGLLSACRPKTLHVWRDDDAVQKPYGFLEFLWKEFRNRRGSRQRKPWLNELKGVEIEQIMPTRFGGSSDLRTLVDLWPTQGSKISSIRFRLFW